MPAAISFLESDTNDLRFKIGRQQLIGNCSSERVRRRHVTVCELPPTVLPGAGRQLQYTVCQWH